MLPLRHISLTFRDRDEIEQVIADTLSRGQSWRALLDLLPFGGAGRDSWRAFCVQRQPQLLGDHTIEENWQLPLWTSVTDDIEEREWLLEQARATLANYSDFSASSYPTQLNEVSKVAAQFSLAHILMPDILLLDAVLSGWHHTDQEMVWRMIKDYANRYPFRSLVYVDVTVPPTGDFTFHMAELVKP